MYGAVQLDIVVPEELQLCWRLLEVCIWELCGAV